jgi:nicotinate-nucleotide adenylyltransferase
MRVGVYGGSFDPIHKGHLEPAAEAASRLGLDIVVFVPAFSPPHKPEGPTVSAYHRFAMAALAIAPYSAFRVSDFEVTRRESTFTVDTLRAFRAIYPEAEVVLVLGSDSLATFATWRAWREMADETRIAVLAREPWLREETARVVPPELAERFAPDGAAFDGAPDGKTVLWAGNDPVTISSTWLRSALREEKPEAEAALPPSVVPYLKRHGLYGATPNRP